MSFVRRVGAFLEVLDEEGCRHLLRLSAIQAVSDTDPFQNETLITAAGRTIRVPRALDEIVVMLTDRPTLGASSRAHRATEGTSTRREAAR